MANPQTENGYIKIANDIWEALTKIRIPGESRQCLDFIIRKTWGFQKKEDQIPLSQFCLATGINKPNVCKNLAKLREMNIIFIIQKDNGSITSYRFNKDFDTWKPLSKKITLPKTIIQKDNESLSKKIHSKDNNTKKRERESINTLPIQDPFNTTQYKKILEWLINEKKIPPDVAELELLKFKAYWTEPNAAGKLRWQEQKFFGIRRRLATWFSRKEVFETQN